MPKLVIVESPAKAKTIERFLGKDFTVQASFGHVRDLPESADEIPAAIKKERWARLGVNVDRGYEPVYVVPANKKRHVENLRRAAAGVDEVLLATDEDREGESISWHVLKLLKLPKGAAVRRIVFHEITEEAIRQALANPRELDERLVRAQETRRILDRLYGYTLSPLLWKKVAPKLSAGRVQSVAVRLCVLRERERRAFKSATYWDIEAKLRAPGGPFDARLVRLDGRKIASSATFDSITGAVVDPEALILGGPEAKGLATDARGARPWTVAKVEQTPGVENPPEPFMTATLQQEASRKLGFNAKRTMSVAQELYEGVDLGDGQREGLITYMRTDSLHLSERALREARDVLVELYGPDYALPKPRRFKTRSKAAQEAHEAIRPTVLARKPQDVRPCLGEDQFNLYDLIWKRTLACQMPQAQVRRTYAEVVTEAAGRQLTFATSGKEILFPGFLRVYVEGSDDPEAALADKETTLPRLDRGMEVEPVRVEAKEHATKPPARYTEASLVKKLEQEGIGRPSTYATILSTIVDRGYVFRRGKELVPTFTAFAVTELLEGHFADLVDVAFTAKMEGQLDEIADGDRDPVRYLDAFYRGENGREGLRPMVEDRGPGIPFPAIALGESPDGKPLQVRIGRFGPFLQRGEGGDGHVATVPGDLAPDELSTERAIELLERKASGPAPVGPEPGTGRNVLLRNGRYGDYLEVEQTPEERARGDKPRRVTLPPSLRGAALSHEDLAALLRLPREIGRHPESGEPVVATVGQYGPYLKCGAEIRNLDDWRTIAALTLREALGVLARPKAGRSRERAVSPGAAITPIQEFGELAGAAGPVRVLPGRYGPYVTDGTTHATVPKGEDPATLSAERALALLQAKAAAGRPKRRGAPGRRKR
jgi:DNA topoisomerase-1